ncbi:MAG: Eco57I restriction-modification methylase domain-containing protein [Candidatus Hodarchaeota archaeon]
MPRIKIDYQALDVIKEYFNKLNYSKEKIKLKSINSNHLFLEDFILEPNSLFGNFLLVVIRYFQHQFRKNTKLMDNYTLWLKIRERSQIKISKQWKSFLTLVDWKKKNCFEFIFCLETAYTILVQLLLAKAVEYYDFPQFPSSNINEQLIKYSNGKRIPFAAWGIAVLDLLDNFRTLLVESVLEKGVYDWWELELLAIKETSPNSTVSDNGNQFLQVFCQSLAELVLNLAKFDFSEIVGDPFGELYQNYFDKETRKLLGEFYTPIEIVTYILDIIDYRIQNNTILEKRLIDPACGSGTFLIEALKRYLKVAELKNDLSNKFYWTEVLRRLLSEFKIVGLDIHPFAVLIAQSYFFLILLPYYKKAVLEQYENELFVIKKLPIFSMDSLWDLTKDNKRNTQILAESPFHKNVPDSDLLTKFLKNDQFDFVVGNPPYVNIRMIEQTQKEYYKSVYQTARGSFDLYCLFIEKGVNLLTNEGKLGFITSNQFMLSDYGKYVREYLTSSQTSKGARCKLIQILDFRDSRLFNAVINYPCIITLKKTKNLEEISNNKIKFIRVKKNTNQLLDNLFIDLNELKKKIDLYDIFKYPQSELSKNIWTFMPKEERELFNRIWKMKDHQFADVTENIFVGTQTSLDKVYLVNITQDLGADVVKIKRKESSLEFNFERELLKPILKGKDITKWLLNWSNHWLIFPYEKEQKYVSLSSNKLRTNFPKAWEYFLAHKEQIVEREGGKMKNRSDWFAFIYPKNHERFEQTKIISQLLSRKNRFALDIEGRFYFVAVGGNCITLKPGYNDPFTYKYMLALLNSSVMEFFLKHISPVHDGGFYLFIYQYLKQLPIILGKATEEQKITVVRCVEKIFDLIESGKEGPKSLISEEIRVFEEKINAIFYEIYNLKSTEIRTLERFIEEF